MIDELLQLESFYYMLANPYGNYVVQKALEQADEIRLNKLLKVFDMFVKSC